MRNLYDRTVAVPSLIAEKDLTEALNRPTTEDDTHPGPQDRFQLVKKCPRARASLSLATSGICLPTKTRS
jgi:hypothetical protein